MKVKVNGVFVDAIPEGLLPSDPGTMLTTGDDGEYAWVDPTASLFRGAWASDDLIWAGDLAPGLNVEPFSTRVEGPNGVMPVLDQDVPAGQPYSQSARCDVTNTSNVNKSVLTLDLIGQPTLTRVKWWAKTRNAGGFTDWAKQFVMANNTQIFKGVNVNWTEYEAAVPGGTTTLEFMTRGDVGGSNEGLGGYFTGIRLYAAADPYMLGEFVTHDGEMWESLIDNNAQEPSKASTSWKRAITLPAPGGTTAQRPSPVTAGLGFMYFDTTLNQPIWSNATSWVDAVGDPA